MRPALRLACLPALALLAAAGPAEPVAIPIAAGPAGGSAELTGGVARGERDLRSLPALAGQTLTARLTAAGDNAVFQIYLPGARAEWRAGVLEVTGRALAGTEEGRDARSWDGRLAESGTYLFVIGGTRGNASYRLRVRLGPAP